MGCRVAELNCIPEIEYLGTWTMSQSLQSGPIHVDFVSCDTRHLGICALAAAMPPKSPREIVLGGSMLGARQAARQYSQPPNLETHTSLGSRVESFRFFWGGEP